MNQDYKELLAEVKTFIIGKYPLDTEVLTSHMFCLNKTFDIPQPPKPAYFPPPPKREKAPESAPPVMQGWDEVLKKNILTPSSMPPGGAGEVRAKMLSSLWKEREKVAEITALFFEEKERFFLERLVGALVSRGVQAVLVDGTLYEKENLWDIFLSLDPIKKVVVPYEVHKRAHLGRYFVMKRDLCFLHNIPAVVLAPLHHYENNPAAKKALWQMLYGK